MNPLQKKCIIATAGFHLLLLVILFVGPGFFRQEPKTDALPVLKVIPLSAIEAALTSGSAQATPPPVAPPQPKPEPVTPTPPTPEPLKPVVTPPVEPKPVVTRPVEREVEPTPVVVKPTELVVPDEPTPTPKPVHKIEVNLTPVIRKVTNHPHPDTSASDEAAAEAKAERAERAAERTHALAVRRAAESLRDNLTSDTEVTMPGTSSQASVNYGQLVKSMYYDAWTLPGSADNDEASPKVRVVIARDGTVISAHIIEPSGDAAVDASVQRALDRVTFIQPFADDAKEKERAYTIKFDLQTKKML